jgi:hypothetical protein
MPDSASLPATTDLTIFHALYRQEVVCQDEFECVPKFGNEPGA